MAKTRSAGDLYYRFAFDKRVDQQDGYGNTKGEAVAADADGSP